MEIVKFKREQEQHLAHIRRIRTMQPVLNTAPPESLGLKHMHVRPKKMQLIEDRRQVVAKENAKLMQLMTGIMNEKRGQPKYERPPSLNEVERKREVDRLNFENRLMTDRLTRVGAVIDNSKLEEDFKRHVHAEHNLRRKQMKPLSVPKDLHPNSPLRNRSSPEGSIYNNSGMFNASLYSVQRGQFLKGSSLENMSVVDDPNMSMQHAASMSTISNVTDFRKQVIATKKQQLRNNNDELL